MLFDVAAIRDALQVDLQQDSRGLWSATEDECVWWTFELTPDEGGWLITREEGTYTQRLQAAPDGVVAAMRAMKRAAKALGYPMAARPEWAARAEAWIPQAFTAAEIVIAVRWHLHREADMPDTGTARTRAASWVQLEIERDPSGEALRAALLLERPRRRAEIEALFAR